MTLIWTYAPNEEKDEVAKWEFYSSLEKACDAVPNYDMKTVLGDFNGEVRNEFYLYPAFGGRSLHSETNNNETKWYIFVLGRDLAVTGTWYQH